jgi:hypothetical protein
MITKIILIPLFLVSFKAHSEVSVRYMNSRFMWIEADSINVKVHLNRPIDGLSLYSIRVKSKNKDFHFVLRRAWPYKTCVDDVVELRNFLKKNKRVEIIGYPASKEKPGNYFSLWELIRGKSGCIGYFGDCEKYESLHPEWHDWKKNPIDPKIYP